MHLVGGEARLQRGEDFLHEIERRLLRIEPQHADAKGAVLPARDVLISDARERERQRLIEVGGAGGAQLVE